jgi:hypothetical protein
MQTPRPPRAVDDQADRLPRTRRAAVPGPGSRGAKVDAGGAPLAGSGCALTNIR